MSSDDRFLFISDTQIPFEHRDALKFCKEVQKEFGVPDENCFHVGDEVDQYFGSRYIKDPEALHTPNSELAETFDRLLDWYAKFPKLKLCTSNHGVRWMMRASEACIPSVLMKQYQEVLKAPDEWVWRKVWRIQCASPIKVIHGVGYGGMYAYRHAAMDAGMNTVLGHLHSNAGLAWIKTLDRSYWGLNVGCLIDEDAYAFKYNRDQRNRPFLSVGVAVDGGRRPILVPMSAENGPCAV